VYITASVGVAVSPPNTTSELLRSAETAMYAAKSLGRGEIVTFDRKLADEGADRLMLSNDLRDALRDDALTLHYQPVVDLNDGRILGVEALARWQHPIHGPISPVTFVGVAEATGLAPALGRWALVRACREAERLCDLIAAPPRIAVNISARHLAHPDLEDTVLAAMRGSRWAGGGLVLEITETAVMDNPTQARELLQRLQTFGVEASIDDFGTGYSSLAYLSRLPISTLKIDRSFVKDITTDPDALAITASVIRLAHTMRLNVVAEGIETVGQLGLLRQLGCASGQGFLFSPGLPPEAFVDLVGRLPGGRFDVTVPEPHPEAGEPHPKDDLALSPSSMTRAAQDH
jgi:EAL domain-containing protein (putative c-di-GMP-specific phosphodiesterase class I)